MASKQQKKDWIDLNDDDEKVNFEPRVESELKKEIKEEKDPKTGNLKKIQETIKVVKYVFPVSRAVIERKNMKKFADCAGLASGKNKAGEVQLDMTVRIETQDNEDRFEIDIVNKIKGLNQDEIRQRKLEERIQKDIQDNIGADLGDDMEQIVPGKGAKRGGTESLKEWAQKVRDDSQQASIKIENIVLDQGGASTEQEEEEQFKEFIAQFINKLSKKLKISDRIKYQIKVLRNKGMESNVGRAFLSINDPNIANIAYEELNECQYGSCVLDVKWAEAKRTDGNRGDRGDRGDRRDKRGYYDKR